MNKIKILSRSVSQYKNVFLVAKLYFSGSELDSVELDRDNPAAPDMAVPANPIADVNFSLEIFGDPSAAMAITAPTIAKNIGVIDLRISAFRAGKLMLFMNLFCMIYAL
jgi:hypothetical protein